VPISGSLLLDFSYEYTTAANKPRHPPFAGAYRQGGHTAVPTRSAVYFESNNQEVTKMKSSQLAALCFASLLALLSGAAAAQPYTLSADGLEVTDQKTGLIWRRCAEGLLWNGSTCTGTALTFTHESALARAKEVSGLTAVAWRLPNIKELASIADKSLSNPAIDATAFPATPANVFWSASPYIGYPAYAWNVYFLNGYVNYYSRTNTYYVRLVRAGQ
jgi:hypothetical protein